MRVLEASKATAGVTIEIEAWELESLAVAFEAASLALTGRELPGWMEDRDDLAAQCNALAMFFEMADLFTMGNARQPLSEHRQQNRNYRTSHLQSVAGRAKGA